MRKFGLAWMALTAAVVGALSTSRASGPDAPPAACEPGFKWVQVTEYREVCRDVCKIVPDVKETKKWVYSQIDDPFCIKRSGRGCADGACANECASCEGPYCRKQLVKKLVICKEPTTKCVVEKIMEKVPCTVYRKVPCDEKATPAASAESLPKGAAGKK